MFTIHFPLRVVIFLVSTIFVVADIEETVTAQPPAPTLLAPGQPPQETGSRISSPEIYKVLESDDAETRLMKELINNLQAESDMAMQGFQEGREPFVLYYDALHRLTEARLEFHTEPEDQHMLLREQLEMARKVEARIEAELQIGSNSLHGVCRSKSFRIKAELALLRFEKAQAKKLKD